MKGTKDGVASSTLATKQSPKSTDSKAPRTGSNDDSLKKVQGMVKEWLDYRKKLLPMWERDIKLYNNERVERHYEGVADTFVPMTFSTVETIVSALATGDLSTDFIPQDIYKYLKDRLMPGFRPELGMSEDEFLVKAIQEALTGGVIEDESLEVLNALYDYFWDCGNWSKNVEHLIKSGIKIGNGALWETWENGKPKLVNVPFPDFVFDPKGISDDTGKFKGRRYLASLSDMKKETIIDPETGKEKKRYNFKGLNKTDNAGDEKTDKDLKEEMLFGSTVYVKNTRNDDSSEEEIDQVEVIELWTDDRIYALVNRKCLAEDAENPIVAQAKLRGLPTDDLITQPAITWANYEDESLYIGKSETSTFWQEQERLNDATNQKSDAVTRALLQQYQADPSLKSQKASFSVPGAVIWATQNQFNAIPPAQVPNAAFNEEVSVKNNIREVTATDQIVKGVGSSQDITATEANLQVAQSSQRIELKIESLSQGPLKRLANLTLQYIRLFIADPFIVPQQANGGIKPLFYDPNKYNYDFDPKVTLTIQAQNKKKQEKNEALETYQILIQDPTNNLTELKKVLLPKIVDLDKDEIARIIENPQQPAMPPEGDPNAMPVDPMQAGVLPPDAPLPAGMPL